MLNKTVFAGAIVVAAAFAGHAHAQSRVYFIEPKTAPPSRVPSM
jgi:MFS-type transporter involved in bile tolerance (Atg22 family)